jgi:hypothetical protein
MRAGQVAPSGRPVFFSLPAGNRRNLRPASGRRWPSGPAGRAGAVSGWPARPDPAAERLRQSFIDKTLSRPTQQILAIPGHSRPFPAIPGHSRPFPDSPGQIIKLLPPRTPRRMNIRRLSLENGILPQPVFPGRPDLSPDGNKAGSQFRIRFFRPPENASASGKGRVPKGSEFRSGLG